MQERFNHAEGISYQLLAGINYIKTKRPLAFVIERARAFTWGRHQPCFHKALKVLKAIKDVNGALTYTVQWRYLDATFAGLPPSRPRVFITGFLRARRLSRCTWPRTCNATSLNALLDPPARMDQASSPDLSAYSDATVINLMSGMQRILARGGQPLTQAWIIDCNCDQRFAVARDRLPCSWDSGRRACAAGLFVTNRGRMLTTAELLRLVGINPLRLHLPPNVSEAQLATMVSATVCVPVLARVTFNLCKALGIVPMHAKALQLQPLNCCRIGRCLGRLPGSILAWSVLFPAGCSVAG